MCISRNDCEDWKRVDFRIFAYEWEKFGDAKEVNENEIEKIKPVK